MVLAIMKKRFESIGFLMMKRTPGICKSTKKSRFRAAFRASPLVCALVWRNISCRLPSSAEQKHLLWALLFLKGYASEHINCFITGSDEKTFRKWSWFFVALMARMKAISWERRLVNREKKKYKASVDGTDFMIYEPSYFSPKWFSHKFKGPGLRYEVGVGIDTAYIVWAYGPFPCGEYNDLKIYRMGMKKCLQDGEKVVGDGGYKDNSCSSGCVPVEARSWGYVRARHEAVNKRIKQFMVMGRRFRHSLRLHSICFHAVCNVTQLLIKNGEPVFE